MSEQAKVRTHILPSDVDAQDNVVIWDHGPQEPVDAEPDSEERKRYEAEAKEWHRLYGEGPVPVTVKRIDASHAVNVEPARFNIEPYNVDDAAVDAKVKEIQDKRAADAKVAEEQRAAAQLNEDRKVAVAAVMAEKQQQVEADRLAAKRPKVAPVATPQPANDITSRELEARAKWDEAEAQRIAGYPASTPSEVEAAKAKAAESRRRADEYKPVTSAGQIPATMG